MTVTPLRLATSWLASYLGRTATRLRDDEEGLTTTEIAVITFLLVGAAIVVMGIIYAAATGSAESIPVPEEPSA